MDILSLWQNLKNQKAEVTDNSIACFYRLFFNTYLSDHKKYPFLAQLDNRQRKILQKALFFRLNGDVLEVGSLPQCAIALFNSLYFILKGQKALIISLTPFDLSSYSGLLKIYKEDLKINIVTIDPATGAGAGKEIYENEIIFTNYLRFCKDFHESKSIPGKGAFTALVCEVDESLYERRILFFDKEGLKSTSAVFQTTGRKSVPQDKERILDFKNAAAQFSHLYGLNSILNPEIEKELKAVYGISAKRILKLESSINLPALVFRNMEEKYKAICREIDKADTNALVFYFSPPTLPALKKEFTNKGYEVLLIPEGKGIKELSANSGGAKKVGLCQGVPRPEGFLCANEKSPACLVAEHFPFSHHHAKIKFFCKEALRAKNPPRLFFSLDEQVPKIYTENSDFSRSFALIEFTEKRYSTYWMRKLIARRILNNIQQLRKLSWDESTPLLTGIFAQPSVDPKREKDFRKEITKSLNSLCFCGSGKKFKDCHGKI